MAKILGLILATWALAVSGRRMQQRSSKSNVKAVSEEQREQADVDEHAVPRIPGLTRLRFKMPVLEAGSALAEVATDAGATLTAEEKALTWQQESDFFMRQPAVQSVWQHKVKILDYSKTSLATKSVVDIRSHLVPGLPGVSFGTVFAALAQGGCPLWMIGGTVRDLLSDRQPNDVDCAALCDSNLLRSIANQNGWKNDGGSAQYFSIGEAHGDNEEYLEGFSLDLVFTDPFTPEWSVNMLLWSLTYDYVIDPSGYGVDDAAEQVLRPGAPEKDFVMENSQWGVWRQWVLKSFSTPSMQRHVRYIKMRARGWQPASECVRHFMANQLVVASGISNTDPTGPQTPYLGEAHPTAPGGILSYVAGAIAGKSAEKQAEVVSKMLAVMQEDLDLYFNADGRSCLGRESHWVIAKDSTMLHGHPQAPPRSFHEVFQRGLAAQCTSPSNTLRQIKNQQGEDFVGACNAIAQQYQKLYGKQLYVSSFSMPAMGPGMMPPMPPRNGMMPMRFLIPPNRMPAVVNIAPPPGPPLRPMMVHRPPHFMMRPVPNGRW